MGNNWKTFLPIKTYIPIKIKDTKHPTATERLNIFLSDRGALPLYALDRK